MNLPGFSLYSIGTTRSAKKRWQALFSPMYKYVAKAMARNVLDAIRQGATVNVAGLDINNEGANGMRLIKGAVIVNRTNFGGCGLDGYNVRIVGKDGKKLFAVSDDYGNALLLPYILGSLFGD